MNQLSSAEYLMALDAGTGSVRAVIFDLNGNQIAAGRAGGYICPYLMSLGRWSLI